jgi:hypothetical protein
MMNYSYVIKRLNDWSIDRMRREDNGIGWPNKLPGYDGMPIGNGSKAYSPAISDEFSEVDQCVCALRAVDEILYQTVMLTYVYRSVTPEQRLKRLACCKQSYYNHLNRAHARVQDFLTDLSIGLTLPLKNKLKSA